MASNESATAAAARRRLRVELKSYRVATEKTQRDVAQALFWSASKVIRIESGEVGVSVTDLQALLGLYGVDDKSTVERLIDWAQKGRKQPWSQYKDILSAEFIRYLGYVSAAYEIRQYQNVLVPGMLQTEDYTRALMRGAFGRSEEQAEAYVAFRQEYRETLTSEGAPRASMVLDEGIARRAVGGTKVMHGQLEHLRQLAQLPNVDIRFVPFGKGAHPGMRGPFTHLTFGPGLDDIVHLENPQGDSFFFEDPDASSEYAQRHEDLEKLACTPEELGEFLDRAIARLSRDEAEAGCASR